jgi:limonene-1,2-epoxide hydrolase
MKAERNMQIARTWLAAFNAQDLDALLALYAEHAVHTSPKLRARQPETGGRVTGKAALRTWWQDAFARLPGLRYEETAITADDARVLLEYVRHAPNEPAMSVAEVFEVEGDRIVASRVYHG